MSKWSKQCVVSKCQNREERSHAFYFPNGVRRVIVPREHLASARNYSSYSLWVNFSVISISWRRPFDVCMAFRSFDGAIDRILPHNILKAVFRLLVCRIRTASKFHWIFWSSKVKVKKVELFVRNYFSAVYTLDHQFAAIRGKNSNKIFTFYIFR